MARSRERGELEREVLACLAAADSPLSVAQVHEQLGQGLAYTTVLTTLSRLHDKRAVDRRAEGRGFSYYLPAGRDGAEAAVTAHRMHRLLADGQDRAGVLARFVAELSDEDEQLLERVLREQDAPVRRPGRRAR